MSELLTTARPYAKALFKSAKEKNMLDQYFSMLKNLNMVLDNKDIFDLNDLEVFLILKILIDLDFQETFKSLTTEFLLYKK